MIAPAKWEVYDRWRAKGYSQAEACRKAGISQPSAWRREAKIKSENNGVYAPGDLLHAPKKNSGSRIDPKNRDNPW